MAKVKKDLSKGLANQVRGCAAGQRRRQGRCWVTLFQHHPVLGRWEGCGHVKTCTPLLLASRC